MKNSRKRPLGAGVSVKDWIAQSPDRFVTRADLGLLFLLYERAQARARQQQTWYRRLWRWLLTPILGFTPEAPSTDSPLPSSSSSSSASAPASSSASGGASADAAAPPSASPRPATPAPPVPPDSPTK
jgi:hypothetical protein